MKQIDKELLLKDLCARLPYRVKVQDTYYNSLEPAPIWLIDIHTQNVRMFADEGYQRIEYIKPYLFPLSNMTEEQCYDFYCRFIENEIDYDDFKKFYFENNEWHKLLTSIDDCDGVVDWFNRNHFDYRGLIPMRLANDATGLNIY